MAATDDRHVAALDGLRAIAATCVLVTHVAFTTGTYSAGLAGALLARLDVGVALFFVLSGYLLYLPHARQRRGGRPALPVGAYLVRRVMRIVPAYLLVVAVAFAVLPQTRARLSELPLYLGFLQTATPGHLVAGLTQTWSLGPEVAFYLLLPVWALLLRRLLPADGTLRREVVPLAVIAFCGPLWLLLVDGLGWMHGTGALLWAPSFAAWFAAGMLLSVLRVDREVGPDPSQARSWLVLAAAPGACWVTAAALLVVAASPVGGTLFPGPAPDGIAAVLTKNLLYTAVAFLALLPLVLAPAAPGRLVGALGSATARAVGRWSYSVFLLHLLVIEAVLRITGTVAFTGRFWPVLGLTFVLTLMLAAISWRLVEAPTQRAAHRWTAPRDDGRQRQEGEQLGGRAVPGRVL